MPKIQRTAAQTTPNMTAIPISQGGGYAAPGRALQGLGNALQGVGQQWGAEAEKQERFEAQTKLTEFYNQERLALDQNRYNYQGDGKTFATDHMGGFNERAQAVLASLSPGMQKQYGNFVERIRGSIALGAQNFGQERLLGHNVNLAKNSVRSLSQNINDFNSLEQGVAQAGNIVASIPGLAASGAEKLKGDMVGALVDGYIGRLDQRISDPRASIEDREAALAEKAKALELIVKKAAPEGGQASGPAITPNLTSYSPQAGGDKMQGGYPSSRKGPDGQALVRTLADVAAGRSKHVTLAGNPNEYGKEYVIPKIDFIGADGKKQTLTNVRAVVHDTGSAFKNAPTGRYDLAADKDMGEQLRNANHALWKQGGVQFVAKGGSDGGGTVQGPTGKQVELPKGKSSPFELAKTLLGGNEHQHARVLSEVFKKAAGQNIDPRKTPWCAAFVNAVLGASGKGGTGSLAARSFLKYGQATSSPSQGDIVVLSRGSDPSKGHVGFYAGRDSAGNILVLGGNQGDKISVAPYAASRVLGFRKIPDAGSPLPPGSSLPVDAREAGAQSVRQNSQTGFAATNNLGPDGVATAGPYAGLDLSSHYKTLQTQAAGIAAHKEFFGIASGQITVNPHDDLQSKRIDKLTDASGIAQRIFAGDPQAVEGATRFVQNYGKAPDGIARAIHGLVTHPQDLSKRALGYRIMESILSEKPSAFEGVAGGKKLVGAYEEFQAERMFTPDAHEAMRKVAERKTPEWEAKHEARKKIAEDKAKNISWADVQEATGWSWMGRRTEGDVISNNFNDGAAALLGHYRERFKIHYTATGDVDRAKAMVGLEFKRTYQDSRLFGRATIMRHAPDKVYAPLPESGDRAATRNHKWIEKQAKEYAGMYQAAAGDMGSNEEPEPVKIEDDEIALMSDDQTEREVRAGRAPSYKIRVRNQYYKALGIKMDDVLPFRFTPDYNRALAEVTEDRAGRFEKAREIEKAVRNPYVDDGSGTGVETRRSEKEKRERRLQMNELLGDD